MKFLILSNIGDMKNQATKFIYAMDTFIEGKRRGTDFARDIEGMFAELYDDDERFEDLQHALAMFGAVATIAEDEEMLIKEFKHAKNIILKSNP